MYVSYGSEWRSFGHPRKRRSISSVILDKGISNKILADIKEFVNNPSWYSDRGKNIYLFIFLLTFYEFYIINDSVEFIVLIYSILN